MEKYNRIGPKKKSARMIASEFRKATGKSIDPAFVHWLADKKKFQKFHYGKETYYASNLRTVVDANYYTMYPIFLKEKEQKKLEREKPREIDYDPDKWIEGDTSPRFYVPEGRIISIIREEIEETVRGVLKANNPNYVDLKTAINNFNKWFKGSKVVEENGDPLLCYHGTPKGGFTTFNTIEGVDKKTKWQLLFGSHFTNDMEQAKVYMGNTKKKTKMLYTVFLSIKNPLDITYGKSVISKPLTSDEEYAFSERPELVDAIKEVIPKRMLNKHRINDRYNECYHLWNLLNDMTPFQARKVVEQLGYDGIKYDARYLSGVYGYNRSERRDVSWIAFYPNQIKSACNNNGMFDPNSGNINE